MYVYVVSSIFMNTEGAYKKYSICYKNVELAIEYVELDMKSQYSGAFESVWTDAVKQNILGRGDYFFRYGQNQHYIIIERMEVQKEQPVNVDNVVIFGQASVEEPIEESVEESVEEPIEEAEEESVELVNKNTIENIGMNEEEDITPGPESIPISAPTVFSSSKGGHKTRRAMKKRQGLRASLRRNA